MSNAVHAPALAAAADALHRGVPDAGSDLVAAVQKGEEVFVPLADDRDHPLAFGNEDDKFLAAFTSIDRVVWALPDGPPLAVVDIREVLGWIVRFGGALRLDLSSTYELTIDPAAAAQLRDGKLDGGVSSLATGTRPSVDETPPAPAAAPVPPTPAADTPIPAPRYGSAWDEASTAVAQGLTEDEARQRHHRGEPYVAVFPDLGQRGGAVVEVSPERVTTRFLDNEGRDDLVYGYRREGDRLFHDQLVVKEYGPGASRDDPKTVTLLRYQPDGTQRVWIRDEAGEEHVTDSYGIEFSSHWDDFPEFGTYDAVLRQDR